MEKIANYQTFVEQEFKGIDVSGQEFTDIEFEECEFIDCDFSHVCFARSKFIACSFSGCNFSLAQFPYTRLNDVHFRQTKLVGVDWTRANWPAFNLDQQISFKQCILNDNSFFGLTMHELVLDDCKLHDADFRDADLTGAKINGCDLTNSLFMRTNLRAADLTESQNYYIDVLENQLREAKFTRFDALVLLESLGIELVD